MLASASFDATIGMWEYVGGDFSFIASFEGHENEVKSVAWNSAGTLMASCSRDKSVWIWEVLPGHEFECVSVLNGHTQDVKMLVWHPSLDILVSTSYDNTIKVWTEDGDGDDWHCAQTLGPPGRGHTSTVWSASFNATGDCLVTSSDDLTLIVWDTSADLTNSGSDDSAKWYILESSISLSGTFASIEFAAKRVNHTRVSTRCTLSCHSLCSIFSQETSNHHIGISRPDNFFR
ncbi:hypothetical protein KC19_9G186200 [Ceratodon purpureus]|uniref:Cytosolic iron-sulfur protein assembly protein CIAO1 homolog n=1 Tax=Ceratodon purpureus TaxID=3225 RepID=A0A8T0GYZ7_CERPU|nr:hypothetical protein KC19_9G186200 [Ceratodon purpureus]KAG0562968.1 hypothetical protein KC19_9G186200 [Ceratodon purpureus]